MERPVTASTWDPCRIFRPLQTRPANLHHVPLRRGSATTYLRDLRHIVHAATRRLGKRTTSNGTAHSPFRGWRWSCRGPGRAPTARSRQGRSCSSCSLRLLFGGCAPSDGGGSTYLLAGDPDGFALGWEGAETRGGGEGLRFDVVNCERP